MKTVTFTEFRKHASGLFSEVERGEHPAGVAPRQADRGDLSGLVRRTDSPSWKRPGLRLTAKGASLSAAILQERRREDVL